MVWVIILIVAFSFSVGTYALYQIHMFQLNSYKPKVQRNWLLANRNKILVRSTFMVLLGLWIMLNPLTGIPAAVLYSLAAVFFHRKKNYKKPLVYTSRVIRLLVTLGLFYSVAGIALFLNRDETLALAWLLPGFYLMVPLLVLVANLINQPVEKAVKQWYINDAKRMLKGMPELTVVGITGSYGKTSVKFFLSKLLSAEFNVLHTPESYNTPMGVVKTIRQELKAFHNIFICEMGAKNIGDIKEICDIVHPMHGVITAVGPQHLESFQTVNNVLKTKFELADSLPGDGYLFLNYDNELIRTKKEYPNIVSYGLEPDMGIEYLAYDLKLTSRGTSFKMKAADGAEYVFETKLIGRHNVENIAAAIAAANKLGVPMQKLILQVRQISAVQHRLELLKRNGLTIIDDAYNSNPAGAKAALDTLACFEGIKILMTPGMIELGDKQYECNKNFGVQAAAVCDYVILVGESQTKPIYDGLLEAGYDKARITVITDLKEGFNYVYQLKADDKEKVLLLENDLPDNF